MRTLSINDTNVLKGIALLLLLCHHCFYPGEPYDDIILFGHPVVQNIGEFSKLCVAIFVFLSGYGLTIQTMAKGGIGNVLAFYRRRYVKLMINYWLIWLIFVPIGVFFFHRTFPLVYGEHYIFRAFWDFLGLYLVVFGQYGYNATWWFYSCIIVLYLFYPLIWRLRDFWFVLIPFAYVFPVITQFVPFIDHSLCQEYFLSFVCGMSLAYLDPKIKDVKLGGAILLTLVFFFVCIYRFYAIQPSRWDAAVVILGITLYCTIQIPTRLLKGLSFFGKHSFNIFLFHSFILGYYLHDYIYWSRSPLLIFLTLLVVCTPISMLIEWIKDVSMINCLQNRLVGNS